ncbi:MAG: DUF4260 domain-containing protein [Chloroflexota bacterium]
MPNALLRLEGLTVFISAIALYAHQGFSGLEFIVLLLVPDVSMMGYRVNNRVGSWVYNAAHVYTIPALVIGLGLALNAPIAIQIGLIWFAHIGMDRIMGYGLKYATEFKDTHMQRV